MRLKILVIFFTAKTLRFTQSMQSFIDKALRSLHLLYSIKSKKTLRALRLKILVIFFTAKALRFIQSSQSFIGKALRSLRLLNSIKSKKNFACFAVKNFGHIFHSEGAKIYAKHAKFYRQSFALFAFAQLNQNKKTLRALRLN